jgi:ElaB/YqjD/DUF883 family membrane-anchored ribosome-binding protein
MFHRRPAEFEPRISAINEHLRGIRRELGALGNSAGQHASAKAATAVEQVVEAIRPILTQVEDRLRTGQQSAIEGAQNLGSKAVEVGSKVGSDALERVSEEAEEHPLLAIAVALGVGFLLGVAVCRSS